MNPFTLLAAKICVPIAVVFYILSHFFYFHNMEIFIVSMLFYGWLASYEVCTAYERLIEEKRKDK